MIRDTYSLTSTPSVVLYTMIYIALGLSFGCESEPPRSSDRAGGEIGGEDAGESAGEDAGERTGAEAGSPAGYVAGDHNADDMMMGGVMEPAESPLPPPFPPRSGPALDGAARLDDTPPSGVRVGWVDEPGEALTGQDVACRVGSIRMENAIVRVCIQGEYSLTQFKRRGGNLIDALRWGAPMRDGISEIIVAPGLGEVTPERIEILADGQDGGPAIVQVRGVAAGSRILTSYVPSYVPRPMALVNEYHLYPDAEEVELHTWIEVGDRALSTQISDFVVWSDPAKIYYPLQEGERIPSRPAYLGAHLPHLSYLWRVEGQAELFVFSLPALPFQPIGVGQVVAPAGVTLYLKRVLMIGDGGVSDLASAAELAPPSAAPREFHVSAITADGSSVSARALTSPDETQDALSPDQLLNRINVEVYSVNAEGGRGALIAQTRTRPRSAEREGAQVIEGGEARVALAEGEYWMRAPEWSGGAVSQRVTVSDGGAVELSLPAPGLITLRERLEDMSGVALDQRGSKWVFTPVEGSDTPDTQVAERERQILFVLGSRAVKLAPGSWRLQVSRGWHFGVSEQLIEVESGARSELEVTLAEELPLTGWSSGEFHQHSAPSLDSAIDFEMRILSNIAEGVGFMVPSDHDALVDYSTFTQEFGYERDVGTPITGLEISPLAGHLGAYGIEYRADDPQGAGGAPPLSKRVTEGAEGTRDVWALRTIPELITEARERGAEVIQVNHPRDSTGYFDTVGLALDTPSLPEDHAQWTSDFETLEVFNGAGDVCAVMRDWQSLLARGMRVTAVGNSDSHDLGRPVGYPRNYLPTQAPRPQEISRVEVVSALREGRVSVGGGALIELTDGRRWGDELAGSTARVGIRLRTPSFSQLTRVRALFNGREVWSLELSAPLEALTDFDDVIELELAEDGFLIFFAEGPNLSAVHPGQPTFALSNPLWVDADSDGRISLPDYRAPEPFATGFCQSL